MTFFTIKKESHTSKKKRHVFYNLYKKRRIWFHIVGIGCIIWFLFRVLPKPDRFRYPCQQMSITVAMSYIAFWTVLLTGLGLWIKKTKHKITTILPAIFVVLLLIFTITGPVFATNNFNFGRLAGRWDPIPKEPIGTPKGYKPGRVTWVWNVNATEEDLTGYWWQKENNNQTVIDQMVSDGIKKFAGVTDEFLAWDLIFKHFNKEHGSGEVGYQSGEKIAIKVNLNNCFSYTEEDNDRDVSPQVIKALLRQLVNIVNVSQDDITIYDASRHIGNWFYNRVYYEEYPASPPVPEFPDVHYVDKAGGATGREKVVASSERVYFAAGSCAYRTLPTCVTDADYLINMPLLKRHPINTGVTLAGKNFFGTWMEDVAAVHDYHYLSFTLGNPAPQTDLFAHEHIGDKVVLWIGDGLYATPNDHRVIGKFNMHPFNNDWTNSLYFSQDPVALDSVMYDFLHAEGTNPCEGSQNYLHQSAEPPEGVYDPENDGEYLSESLGVHEHWNTTFDIFSPERYSGPSNDGIDYIACVEDSLKVDAHGPYEGEMGEEIEFTGNATGGTPPYTWHWDFGNGNSSNEQNPVYTYNEAGKFDVILSVRDTLGLMGYNTTTATVIGPILSITPIKGGVFTLKTSIKNEGIEAKGVNWKITLDGGAIIGAESEGINLTIQENGEASIASNFIFGFGPTVITVESWIQDGPSISRQQNGFVFLFFIRVKPGGNI
jgi:hypothetical protein